MGIMFYLLLGILIVGATSIFSRLPLISGFTFFGFSFLVFITFILKNNIMDSTIVLFLLLVSTLMICLQLFMNVDLEKEFQKAYKKNITPVVGMIFTAFTLGGISLVIHLTEKKGLIEKAHLKTDIQQEYAVILVITMMMLLGIVLLVGLFDDDK
ncbi:MAG: hypothetical protein KC493_05190 [Bacteriovoracaceae bacterium]|nr:hypothetical protein [Bacteriovoracaceae bacterium]